MTPTASNCVSRRRRCCCPALLCVRPACVCGMWAQSGVGTGVLRWAKQVVCSARQARSLKCQERNTEQHIPCIGGVMQWPCARAPSALWSAQCPYSSASGPTAAPEDAGSRTQQVQGCIAGCSAGRYGAQIAIAADAPAARSPTCSMELRRWVFRGRKDGFMFEGQVEASHNFKAHIQSPLHALSSCQAGTHMQ